MNFEDYRKADEDNQEQAAAASMPNAAGEEKAASFDPAQAEGARAATPDTNVAPGVEAGVARQHNPHRAIQADVKAREKSEQAFCNQALPPEQVNQHQTVQQGGRKQGNHGHAKQYSLARDCGAGQAVCE